MEADLQLDVFSGDKGRAGGLPINLSLQPQAFLGLSTSMTMILYAKKHQELLRSGGG